MSVYKQSQYEYMKSHDVNNDMEFIYCYDSPFINFFSIICNNNFAFELSETI